MSNTIETDSFTLFVSYELADSGRVVTRGHQTREVSGMTLLDAHDWGALMVNIANGIAEEVGKELRMNLSPHIIAFNVLPQIVPETLA